MIKEIDNLNTQEKIEKLEETIEKLENNVSEYYKLYYTVKTIQLAAEYANYMDEAKIYPNEKNNHSTYIYAIKEALEFVCQYMIEDVIKTANDMEELEQIVNNIIKNTGLRRIKWE